MQSSWVYRECMRNHAAKLGSYAIDGCREYSQPATGDLCAACNCHRSYHRRVDVKSSAQVTHARLPFSSLRRVKQLARQKWKTSEERGKDEDDTEETSTEDKMTVKRRRRKSKYTAEQREAMRDYPVKLGWTLKDKREIY